MLWKPTERQLWKRIKPLFEQGGGRAYRIETTTIPGFPDVIWFPVNRPAVLIELKSGPRIFGQHQISLMWRLHKIGHTVWVVWQEKLRTDVIVYDSLVFAGPDPDVAVKPKVMEFNEWLTWIGSAQ
jgi:hypothetical protein